MLRKTLLFAMLAVSATVGWMGHRLNTVSITASAAGATVNTSSAFVPITTAQAGCSTCLPVISRPFLRYLQHNSAGNHEVEVSFSYTQPSCFGPQPTPNFTVTKIELTLANGVRRQRIAADIAESRSCTSNRECKQMVRVEGQIGDGRPQSYFASVTGDFPIQVQLHGVSPLNNPF